MFFYKIKADSSRLQIIAKLEISQGKDVTAEDYKKLQEEMTPVQAAQCEGELKKQWKSYRKIAIKKQQEIGQPA